MTSATPMTGATFLADRITTRLIRLTQAERAEVLRITVEELSKVPVLAGNVGLIAKMLPVEDRP